MAKAVVLRGKHMGELVDVGETRGDKVVVTMENGHKFEIFEAALKIDKPEVKKVVKKVVQTTKKKTDKTTE